MYFLNDICMGPISNIRFLDADDLDILAMVIYFRKHITHSNVVYCTGRMGPENLETTLGAIVIALHNYQ
jgi:hypothetical protein